MQTEIFEEGENRFKFIESAVTGCEHCDLSCSTHLGNRQESGVFHVVDDDSLEHIWREIAHVSGLSYAPNAGVRMTEDSLMLWS
jgi:hypothetical protein